MHIHAHAIFTLLGHAALSFGILIFAAIAAGIRRHREFTGANWPTRDGRVHSVNIIENTGHFRPRGVVVTYSYFKDTYESGEYIRNFFRRADAMRFADDIKDKHIQVHYNPANPSISTLRREEVDRLLPIRPENTFIH